MDKKLFLIILVVVSLITPTVCVVKSIQFKQNCSGYLKQAADANSPELSLERLNLAVDYIERHGLTEGYTSVLWRTEDENIGYWYQNLKVCQQELQDCMDGTQLEKSNVSYFITSGKTTCFNPSPNSQSKVFKGFLF